MIGYVLFFEYHVRVNLLDSIYPYKVYRVIIRKSKHYEKVLLDHHLCQTRFFHTEDEMLDYLKKSSKIDILTSKEEGVSEIKIGGENDNLQS